MTRNSWTKLEDGTWGARLEGFSYGGRNENSGLPVTLTTAGGKKTTVILGDWVREFRVKGGTVVKVYRIFNSNDEYLASLPADHPHRNMS